MHAENKEELKWNPIKEETIEENQWIHILKTTYLLPDGKEAGPFYDFKRCSYAIAVAIDTEGNLLCVQQYRHGIKEVTTEFPAGAMEKEDFVSNDSLEEAALLCAKRELKEETGYESNEWIHLITVPSNPTDSDNYAYCFLARNCKKTSDLNLDETEKLEPTKYSTQEIDAMIQKGHFQQPLHIMAWLLAKEKLSKLRKRCGL